MYKFDIREVEAAARDSMFGMGSGAFCISCGEFDEGYEPDTREAECYACGEHKLYGAEEVYMMIA